MAVLNLNIKVTPCFVVVLIFNKMLTLLMLHNILGLPDYVIGELLSSAVSHHDTSNKLPSSSTSSSSTRGIITGDPILLGNCFPGRMSSQSVRLNSSSEIAVKSWSMDDTRFNFRMEDAKGLSLGEKTTVGRVYFNPSLGCSSLLTPGCYTGALDFFHLESSIEDLAFGLPSQADVILGYQTLWFKGLLLNPDTAEMELTLLRALRDRWTRLEEKEGTVVHSSLSLTFVEDDSITIPTTAVLSWPRIIFHPSKTLRFPLVRFGESVRRKIWIENPSSYPLVIQAFVLSAEPGPSIYAKDFLSLLGFFSPSDVKEVETDISKNPLNKRNFFKLVIRDEDKQEIYRRFETLPFPGTHAMLLPVGERAFIELEFSPRIEAEVFGKTSTAKSLKGSKNSVLSDPSVKYTTFVVIRNNLTVIDAVRIEAEAGLGLLKMGKETPGLTSLLTFDLKEQHLAKSCLGLTGKGKKSGVSKETVKQASSSTEPQFTVGRHFLLTNYGKIPVNVRGFIIGPNIGVSSSSYNDKSTMASLIDKPIGNNELLATLFRGVHCQGFGFKIQNCQEVMQESKNGTLFTLRPNESKKINIAFTPDFTVAKTMATLTIVTDEGPFDQNFSQILHNTLNEDFVKPIVGWFPFLEPYIGLRESPCQGSFDCESRSTQERKASFPYWITYSLIATVPKEILSKCDSSLPRPYQEVILYYTLVVFMTCVVMVTTAFAFIDGTRVLNFTFYPAVLMTRPAVNGEGSYMNHEIFTPFRLNDIGKKATQSTTSSSNSETGTQASSNQVDRKGKSAKSSLQNKNRRPEPVSAQSWTSYLKDKIVSPRRGSGGSNTSSMSDSKKPTLMKDPTVVTPVVESSKRRKKEEKKKVNTRSWFQTLMQKTEEKEEEPPMTLPSFGDAFDTEDILPKKLMNKTNRKTAKPTEKESIAVVGSKDKIPKEAAAKNKDKTKVTAAQTTSSNGHLQVDSNAKDLIDDAIVSQWKDINLFGGQSNGQDISVKQKMNDPSVFGEVMRSHQSLVSPFSESTTEFGYWAGGPNGHSSSGSNAGDVIWDSPIEMFEPEKAMRELMMRQQQDKRRTHSYSSVSAQKHVKVRSPKTDLCPLGPPPGMSRSESVSEADQRSSRGGFPAVDTFSIDSLLTRSPASATNVVVGTPVSRPVQTPSPRGWSPSHKTTLQQTKSGVFNDNGLYNTNSLNRSSGPSNIWRDSSSFIEKADHLSSLRDGSTNWNTENRGAAAAVQRPRELNSSIWNDSPVDKASPRMFDWTWSGDQSKDSSTWSSFNQSKSATSPSTGFSLFSGRNAWNPWSSSAASPLGSVTPLVPVTSTTDSLDSNLWKFNDSSVKTEQEDRLKENGK